MKRPNVLTDAKAIADAFKQQGKQGALNKLNEIVKVRKLKQWETVVLQDRAQKIIRANGLLPYY